MKKLILFLMIFLPHLTQTTDQSSEIVTQEQHHKIAPATNHPSEKSPIIWTQPLIINDKNPISVLKLTENIVYNPGKNYNYPYYYQPYPAAIIIDSDNVTIDLAGFNISFDPNSSTSFQVNNPTYGIAITAGTKNIKIISSSSNYAKGSISGFSGYAIYMQGSNQIINNYDINANYIQNVSIHNLLITSNINGIYASYGLEINIFDTDILHNFSSRPTYGIYFSTVLQSTIQNCNVNQNFSWSDMIGIYLQDTINNLVENSQISYNQSLKNGNAIGIQITATSPLTSFANTISKSTANTNLSAFITGKESIGFLINGTSHDNVIAECDTFYNMHGPAYGSLPPLLNPKGYGIKLDNSQRNQITKNRSGYHEDYGFFDLSLISSSFFTNNIAIFNPTANYIINIPNGISSEPLPVVIIYQNNLTTYNYTTPLLANLSILPGSA